MAGMSFRSPVMQYTITRAGEKNILWVAWLALISISKSKCRPENRPVRVNHFLLAVSTFEADGTILHPRWPRFLNVFLEKEWIVQCGPFTVLATLIEGKGTVSNGPFTYGSSCLNEVHVGGCGF